MRISGTEPCSRDWQEDVLSPQDTSDKLTWESQPCGASVKLLQYFTKHRLQNILLAGCGGIHQHSVCRGRWVSLVYTMSCRPASATVRPISNTTNNYNKQKKQNGNAVCTETASWQRQGRRRIPHLKHSIRNSLRHFSQVRDEDTSIFLQICRQIRDTSFKTLFIVCPCMWAYKCTWPICIESCRAATRAGLSFHHGGPRDWTKVIRVHSKSLLPTEPSQQLNSFFNLCTVMRYFLKLQDYFLKGYQPQNMDVNLYLFTLNISTIFFKIKIGTCW